MESISTLGYALLGLIRLKPQSGYDLRKTFIETPMRTYSDSPGSIYPALRRLLERGLIKAGAKDRRGRQEFSVTERGQAALLHWLKRSVTADDAALRLEELMLRFAFMDGNVPRAATLQFLEQLEQHLSGYAEGLRARLERDSSGKPVHTGLLALQAGVEGVEAQLAWARKARVRLVEDMQATGLRVE